MALSDLETKLRLTLRRLPAPLPIWHGQVTRATWAAAAFGVAEQGGRLVSLWGVDRRASGGGLAACVAYAVAEGLLWLELPADDSPASFPSLSPLFPCAERMQRAMADLSGLPAEGTDDQRPWLDHGLWAPG
jgi:Ni,Fe-hydrogenase III component G